MSRKLTQKEFISNSMVVHGDRYDYSKAVYKNSQTKLVIVCREHGDFLQSPNKHAVVGRGCPNCAIDKNSKNRRLTRSEFIIKATDVHGQKYDYTLSDYKGHGKGVKIICDIHGEFYQNASDHLSGKGCNDCGRLSTALKQSLSTDDFINRAHEIHNDKYMYDKVNYISAHKKVAITCKIHGSFLQSPSNHLAGKGCSDCAIEYLLEDRMKLAHKGILYYIKFVKNYHTFYKIGVTKYDIDYRFKDEKDVQIKIIKTWHYDKIGEAYLKEKEILDRHRGLGTTKRPLSLGGNTEVFDFDILGLDTAAGVGGLVAGDIYKTSAGVLMIKL